MELIVCIGEDRTLHVCEPHKDKAKCGVKVINKKPTKQERAACFSCYECTY